MDRNYTDEEVPKKMPWCDQSGKYPTNNRCDYDGLRPYLKKIQEKFGSKVKAWIPTEKQINATYKDGHLPQWVYDYLDGTINSIAGVNGYWTSTGKSNGQQYAWFVHKGGHVTNGMVGNQLGYEGYGLRPVITISKSELN